MEDHGYVDGVFEENLKTSRRSFNTETIMDGRRLGEMIYEYEYSGG